MSSPKRMLMSNQQPRAMPRTPGYRRRWIFRRRQSSRRGRRSSRWRCRHTKRGCCSSGRRCSMRRNPTRSSSRGGLERMSPMGPRYSYIMWTLNLTYARRSPRPTWKGHVIRSHLSTDPQMESILRSCPATSTGRRVRESSMAIRLCS